MYKQFLLIGRRLSCHRRKSSIWFILLIIQCMSPQLELELVSQLLKDLSWGQRNCFMSSDKVFWECLSIAHLKQLREKFIKILILTVCLPSLKCQYSIWCNYNDIKMQTIVTISMRRLYSASIKHGLILI